MEPEVPRELAAEELAEWEKALQEQRAAEQQLAAARRTRSHESIYPLHAKVVALTNRADLLLAKAVATKVGKLPQFLESD
jgi:hypothetical protein